MLDRDKMRRSHRLDCPRWLADSPAACTCDRPWVAECESCDAWGKEGGRYGTEDCAACDGNGEVYVAAPDDD